MTTLMEEETLGERFRVGDGSALPEVYVRYSGPMFATALNLLGNREHAADAVQRAFVQAWRAADRFDPARELKPWLYAITRRAAVDIYRRERRTQEQLILDEVVEAAVAEPPSFVAIWQTWQVRDALARLRPADRQVLRLAYYDGLTQTEIAERLRVPLGTVKSRTSRAQRRLAKLLAHLRD
ncbi:MAG TPA: sigma-70 family RNA polymerase sigma factor [Kribbella sp.]|nr:sigma-70 family RNA polymerase sigma factor [Kribbella sp.]